MSKLILSSLSFLIVGFVISQNDTHRFQISEESDSVFEHLSGFQKEVMCGGATEAPFSGKYLYHKGKGIYACAACGQHLFNANSKYDSGSGWPSFSNQIHMAIIEKIDSSYGMLRVEILCSKCGGHLGHVFEDGPQPTGLRYCVNSAALQFKPKAND